MNDDSQLVSRTDSTRPHEPRLSAGGKKRLALAFLVAAASDVLSAFLEFIPPMQWALDIVTAVLLFLVVGRQWAILPGLIAEAIPGVAVFPFWVLVVGAIAAWGTIKPPGKASSRAP